jgi:hypothetical protein
LYIQERSVYIHKKGIITMSQKITQTPDTTKNGSGVIVFIGLGILIVVSILSGSLGFGADVAAIFWVLTTFAKQGMKKLAKKSQEIVTATAVTQTKKLYDTYTAKEGIAEPQVAEINIQENDEGYQSTTIINQELRELPSPIVGHSRTMRAKLTVAISYTLWIVYLLLYAMEILSKECQIALQHLPLVFLRMERNYTVILLLVLVCSIWGYGVSLAGAKIPC